MFFKIDVDDLADVQRIFVKDGKTQILWGIATLNDMVIDVPYPLLEKAFIDAVANNTPFLDVTPDGVAAIKKKYGPQPFEP